MDWFDEYLNLDLTKYYSECDLLNAKAIIDTLASYEKGFYIDVRVAEFPRKMSDVELKKAAAILQLLMVLSHYFEIQFFSNGDRYVTLRIDSGDEGFKDSQEKIDRAILKISGKLKSAQLGYNIQDSFRVATWKGKKYKFASGNKNTVLLDFLSQNKGSWPCREVIEHCNQHLPEKKKFNPKAKRGLYYILEGIKHKLGVKKEEYFPIYFEEEKICWKD